MDENNQMPTAKPLKYYDLIMGLALTAIGSYRMYHLFNGVAYSKWQIWIDVFTLVLGVFKLYAFYKTNMK